MAARLRPIVQTPALRGEGSGGAPVSVVLADLHLGLGATPERPAGPPGAAAGELAATVVTLCRKERAGRVVVAGDVKHPIVGAPPWLRPVVFDFFAHLLEERIQPVVVLGNHDVGLLRLLPREVDVHGPDGWREGDVGIFHGHRWPRDEVLAAPQLVTGHLHPGYRFAPSPSHPDGKHRCWVRVEFPPPGPADRRRRVHVLRARELVVLPAFHPLAGTEALNRAQPRRGRSFLYQRFLLRGRSRLYLLDGSDLGELPTRWADPAPADR